MDLIAFYADNALIKKATSPEETPTPGYLYHEIVGITHKSVEACQNLENVLLSRLDNESPIVKLKALRTIKHILLKGHVSVKRDLMSRVNAIRPCVHARGPPDQLRGDSLWQSVRTEAQDVLTLIFDTEQRAVAAPVAVSSMGSDQMGTSRAYINSHNHSNSYHSDPPLRNNAPNGTYTPSSSSNAFAEASANYRSSSTTSSFSGIGSTPSSNGTPFGQDLKNKISSLPSKLGGNKPNHELSNFGSIGSVSHAGAHTHASAGSGADWAYTPHAPASHADDEESTLVDDITNSSGSPALTFQALDQFCARSALLDQNRVADLLFKKLEARAWQSRHKALVVIEALLLSSTGSVIRDTCIEKRVAIEALLPAMQPATREKAKQVLTLLGVNVDPNTNATTATPPQASPPIPRAAHDGPAEPTPPASLFAGLAITGPSAPLAPATPSPTAHDAPPLINITESGNDDERSLAAESERNKAANTSLLSFLEASAKIPPSPTPMRELAHAAHANESDDSPLIASFSPPSPSPSLLSPSLLSPPALLHFDVTQGEGEGEGEKKGDASPLIDLGALSPPSHSLFPTSPDILSKFRTPNLKSSAPVTSSPHSSPSSSSFLSTSQPVPSPHSDSFLASLMESPPPSSLAELLETPGVSILAPAPSPSPAIASPAPSPSSKPAPPSAASSSPFAPPPKVPMVANFTAKPTPTTIPSPLPNAPLPHNPHSPYALLTSAYPPSHVAPPNIRTTSVTSVYAPLTSVPRAPPQQTSPTSSSSPSSFNFVQQKKQDHFGDLVSIQIQQMSSK